MEGAELNTYMDGAYAVVENMLLCYSGNEENLVIPDSLAGISIQHIGKGAFAEIEGLQTVRIPRSVTKISDSAFYSCSTLRQVFLPGTLESGVCHAFSYCPELTEIVFDAVEISQSVYNAIRLHSVKIGDKCFLPADNGIKPITDIINTLDYRPANDVPTGIKVLFVSSDCNGVTGHGTMNRVLDCFGLKNKTQATEQETFIDLISSGQKTAADAMSEQKNDLFLRTECNPDIKKTSVLYFDDSKTRQVDGKIYFFPIIRIGYHFWQSAVPVMFDKRLYYIYRRHYLTSEPEMKYIRKDVAIFKGNGLLTNRTEAMQVYGKYKLLSIL